MKVNTPPFLLLFLGILLMAGTHMTISIEILAWIAYIPFLLYLHQTKGWQSRLWFFLAYVVAWSVIVFKIITDPIPFYVIPLYSIPIAAFHLPAFLIWAWQRDKRWANLLFPALMVILEWIQYTFTPFGSWGAAGYTQMDNLVLLQSVSLFGLAGLSFLIYWVNISIASLLIQGNNRLKTVMLPAMVLLGILIFGALRYDLGKAKGREMIKVAAVGTESSVGTGSLPSDEVRRQHAAILFARTRKASKARTGTELVVWNEGSAMVLPEEEAAWRDSLEALATECETALVAAYVVLLSESPFKYENKYLFVEPNGTASTYWKREPVPGEPADKGRTPAKTHTINNTKIAGAICYDYDFPYLAKALGRQGADVVALPSSDWRGIDPIHTKMAAFRAVEQGHSILRSTRFGLSAAITPYGEMVAQMSSFDQNDKIMPAHLPKTGVASLYSLIGDVFVYVCMALALAVGIRSVMPKAIPKSL
jgi:apolipoprotein N-acyltransferase